MGSLGRCMIGGSSPLLLIVVLALTRAGRFTASLDLHRSLFSLASYHTPSENSLVLTYLVPPSPGRELVLTLVFVPNTRTLASAAVAGAGVDGVDVAEVVDAHVLTNDLPGLVAAVLARARGAA